MTRRWPRLRRLLATLLITTLTTACASGRASVSPESRAWASQITSIATIAVEVTVFSSSLFGGDEVRRDWSDTARTTLMHAIARHFGQDSRFVSQDWRPEDAETIRPDLEQARQAIEALRATTPDRDAACLVAPAMALASAAGTDVVLLVYAKDSVMTRGSIAALVPLAIFAFPIMLFLSPLLEPAAHASRAQAPRIAPETVALCLVRPRTGETLWFHTESLGFGNLLDVRDVDRLIQHAYTKFKEFRGP
jgi:hypothetical protein